MNFKIRQAKEEDAGRVEELAESSPPLRPSVEGTYEYLALCFGRYFLLAERGDQLIGFIVSLPSLEGLIWIYQIAVKEGNREEGVGRRLMAEELEKVRADGYENVKARVMKSNEPSQRLLSSFGFEEVGTKGDWIEMGKALSPE